MTNRTSYNKFKAQILERRKSRDPIARAMQLVKTEADKVEYQTNARTPVDSDLFKVLKNTISGLKEVISVSTGDTTFEHDQVELFEKYLPDMLSEKDLVVVVEAIMSVNTIDGMKSMGFVMSELKRLHPGQYDGKMASGMIRNLLIK